FISVRRHGVRGVARRHEYAAPPHRQWRSIAQSHIEDLYALPPAVIDGVEPVPSTAQGAQTEPLSIQKLGVQRTRAIVAPDRAAGRSDGRTHCQGGQGERRGIE